MQEILADATMENKLYFAAKYFNLNCLEFHQSSEIRQFFNNIKKELFEKEAIPLIKRHSRVTTSSAKLTNKIFTKCVFDGPLKKGII